jgi:hypothetical protein
MNDTIIAFLIIVVFFCGAALGATVATAYWQRRRNDQSDATWARYVESERQRTNMRHDLEAARIRTATLEAERDLAAYQLTQLAAVATVATQQAQAGRGYILGETAFERQCWN